jgi:hypothetical protein
LWWMEDVSALTGRAISDNFGNSKAGCQCIPWAQSLSEEALTGDNAVSLGMITARWSLVE